VQPKEGKWRIAYKFGITVDELQALNPDMADVLKEGQVIQVHKITDFETKHIAIMLPFRMHRVDFDAVSDAKESLKKDPYLNVSLDFHSGVLMAIDSLKSLGVSLKVDVYDTRYEVSEVSRIIRENDLLFLILKT